jgi:hypothetical protein
MTHATFSLIPFPDSKLPEIQITGEISRQRSVVEIRYSVTGDVASIHLPPAKSGHGRKDDLWKATCFEFFMALPNQPQYWEYNLSPSGEWNIYHMDAYRRIGFREETLIQNLSLNVSQQKECVAVICSTDISPIVSSSESIQVAITSVIQTKDGHETYWALVHPNLQPDFHVRESFTLALEA